MRIWLEVYVPCRGQRTIKAWEEVPDGMTPNGLLDHLGLDPSQGLTIIVDGRWVPPEQPISGQEVAVLRQSEGG